MPGSTELIEQPGTRQRLLAAAIAEFASYGYEGASTAAIARSAGVTQPVVHYHFGSKEELWRQSISDVMSRMEAVLAEIQSDLRDADPLTQLRAMLRRYARFVGENPDATRLLHEVGSADNERLRWIVEEHAAPSQNRMLGAIEAAQASGQIKDIPAVEVLTVAIGAAVNVFSRAGLYTLQHQRDVRTTEYIEFHSDAVIEIVLNGLRSTDES
jgi:TetR/AcrR family transcriptional regulator